MRALLFVLVLPFAAGCSKKKADNGPACPEVVDHMVEVMKAGLKGHDSVNLGDRKQMIAQCENRKMNAEMRRCMATAKDLAQLASCRPASPPSANPSAPQPAGSAAGSAAGSGG